MDARLTMPIQELPRVNPRQATAIARAGVRNLAEALFFFPRDYEDFRDNRAIADLVEDEPQTVIGEVIEVDSRGGFGKSRVGVIIEDDTDALRAMWFNQAFMRDKFEQGQRVRFSAKPKRKGQRWEMSHPRVSWLDDEEDFVDEGLLPVYPLSEGVTQHTMRRVIATAIEEAVPLVEEVFPQELLEQYGLLPIDEALRKIHHPADEEERDAARRRFIFQELLILQLALAARRHQHRVSFNAPEIAVDTQLDARIRRLFPFELTEGQQQAITDVAADMAKDTPMNRLVQGDVGAGKTVVALYAMLACVAHEHQAALLAPTEVLARQHARTLEKLLVASRVRFRLLVGSMTDAEKQEVRDGLANGDVDLAIGTHALLQEKVEFADLGLAIIDEQHKFGVKQRAALRSGDNSPHYLVMTATPIPRTMSMTQFGDLDVSIIRDMPAGREPVSTYVVTPEQEERWWEFVRKHLRDGRQAFFVTPLVDESETIDAASVKQSFEELTNGELEAFRVGLLHGKMHPAEKEQAMADFREGQTQLLVSTTVIEVGVDVPNATIMMIASPSRFGLSQLHQLRGRVGRGSHAGVCALLLPPDAEDDLRERLAAFAETTDGFELAELDFKIRGPGDLFGAKQSGLPPLRIADLVRDQEVLIETRTAAQELFAEDPGLKEETHVALRRQMLRRYGASLELGDVG